MSVIPYIVSAYLHGVSGQLQCVPLLLYDLFLLLQFNEQVLLQLLLLLLKLPRRQPLLCRIVALHPLRLYVPPQVVEAQSVEGKGD